MNSRKSKNKFWPHLFSAPFIWAPLPFVIVLDIMIEIYHHVCFPIYGLEKVNRKNYVKIIDRGRLQYLRWYEKLGCMYCGYVNGVFPYFKEICNRTETYWCGIMHEGKPMPGQEHQLQHNFAKFDDKDDFEKKYPSPY